MLFRSLMLTVSFGILAAVPAVADYVPFAERYGYEFDNEKPWEESAVVMPAAYPEREDAGVELYVNPTYPNRVWVHLPLELADDGTLRYVLAIRTPGGVVNYSYEGIRCVGNSHKVFAFGSGSTGSWLPFKTAEWVHFDSYRAANDKPRARLMRLFCEEGRPLNRDVSEQLLRENAGKRRLF